MFGYYREKLPFDLIDGPPHFFEYISKGDFTVEFPKTLKLQSKF